jgi:hypothetical protein
MRGLSMKAGFHTSGLALEQRRSCYLLVSA